MREEGPAWQPAGGDGSDVFAYVGTVRRWFCQLTYEQGRFGPADERLARDWQWAGMPLETVRQATLLGSVRRAMSVLHRPGGEPVRSLRYFAGPLEEARRKSFPASYWQYLEFNLRLSERMWRQRTAAADPRARPDLEQASPTGTDREASPTTAGGTKKRRDDDVPVLRYTCLGR